MNKEGMNIAAPFPYFRPWIYIFVWMEAISFDVLAPTSWTPLIGRDVLASTSWTPLIGRGSIIFAIANYSYALQLRNFWIKKKTSKICPAMYTFYYGFPRSVPLFLIFAHLKKSLEKAKILINLLPRSIFEGNP